MGSKQLPRLLLSHRRLVSYDQAQAEACARQQLCSGKAQANELNIQLVVMVGSALQQLPQNSLSVQSGHGSLTTLPKLNQPAMDIFSHLLTQVIRHLANR